MEIGKKFCESLYNEDTDFKLLNQNDITEKLFEGYSKKIFNFIIDHKRSYDKLPDITTINEHCNIKDFTCGNPEPISFYIKQLLTRFDSNKLRQGLSEVIDLAEKKDLNSDLVSESIIILDKVISEIKFSSSKRHGKVLNLRTDIDQRLQMYLDANSIEGNIKLYSTPWPLMDEYTNGCNNGHFWVVAARTGVGKTWGSLLFFNKARECASENKDLRPPLYVSMEMPLHEIAQRADAIRYNLPYSDLVNGDLDAFALDRYTKGIGEKDGSDYYGVDQSLCKNIKDLSDLIDYYKPGIVIVDGFSFFKSDVKDRFQRVSNLSNDLRLLALDKDIPVIGTAQFRSIRDGGSKKNKHELGDIADSDNISRDAYCVIGLYQTVDLKSNKSMMVKILKIRGKQGCNFLSNWDFDSMDFRDKCLCDEEGVPLSSYERRYSYDRYGEQGRKKQKNDDYTEEKLPY